MNTVDRAYYEALTRDQLIARLKVAEDALVLIGWSTIPLSLEQDASTRQAATQAWQNWLHLVPDGSPIADGLRGHGFLDPCRHPELDAMVPILAEARRSRIRDTLAALEDRP